MQGTFDEICGSFFIRLRDYGAQGFFYSVRLEIIVLLKVIIE